MTVALHPDVEQRIRLEAERQGMVAEEYALRLPDQTAPPSRNLSAIRALESLYEGDEAEQFETFDYLKQALDEDRLSDRKIFP